MLTVLKRRNKAMLAPSLAQLALSVLASHTLVQALTLLTYLTLSHDGVTASMLYAMANHAIL